MKIVVFKLNSCFILPAAVNIHLSMKCGIIHEKIIPIMPSCFGILFKEYGVDLLYMKSVMGYIYIKNTALKGK